MNNINPEEYTLTEEEITKMFLDSLREANQRILKSENLTDILINSFRDKVEYATLRNIAKLGSRIELTVEQFRMIVDTVEIESRSCKRLIEALEKTILGDNSDLNKYLSSPLNEVEIHNLSIWAQTCVDIYNIMSSTHYQNKVRENISNIIKEFCAKTQNNINEISSKLQEIRKKAIGRGRIVEEIDKTMEDIMKFANIAGVDIEKNMKLRQEANEKPTPENTMKALNHFCKHAFGIENAITPELYKKVEENWANGTWGFDEKSFKELEEEIRKSLKNNE